jgi:acyl carrier protein
MAQLPWIKVLRRSAPPDNGLVPRVCAVVARALDLPPHLRPTRPDAQLYGQGLGADSLDALRLVAVLEEEFDITIDDAELTPASFQSVGSIVALVEKLRRTS